MFYRAGKFISISILIYSQNQLISRRLLLRIVEPFYSLQQIIWGGKTVESEPNAETKEKFRDNLSHTHTPSHWADTVTVRKLVDDLYASSVVPFCETSGWDPKTTPWMMLWDCTCNALFSVLLLISANTFLFYYLILFLQQAIGRIDAPSC